MPANVCPILAEKKLSAKACEKKAPTDLDSSPPARVLLDGKLLGVTPIADLVIEPGAHDVVFIHGVETR